MPELKPLPCPACGSIKVGLTRSHALFKPSFPCDDKHLVRCFPCRTSGPSCDTESAAINLWNSLPRALTWGEEPPKVAGWYWFSVCQGHAVCIPVGTDGKAKLAKDHFTDAELLGGQWAGPIAPPGE